jgi:DNA-binding GntR family transcriptional regulator
MVLASLAERTQREVRDLCACDFAPPPGLQAHHCSILSCIEAGLAEQAVQHTRNHLQVLREQVVAELANARRYRIGVRP